MCFLRCERLTRNTFTCVVNTLKYLQQIHLEVDPSLYENDDQKYQILMKNDGLRHEIFGDVLNSHLGLMVGGTKDDGSSAYTRGYFLGRHDVSEPLGLKFNNF